MYLRTSFTAILLLSTVFIFAQQDTASLALTTILDMAQRQSIQTREVTQQYQIAEQENKLFTTSLLPQLGANIMAPNFFKTVRQVEQPNGSLALQAVSQNSAAIGLSVSQNIAQTGGRLFVQSNIERFDDFANDYKQYSGIPIRIGLEQPINSFNALKWQKKIAPLRLQEARRVYSMQSEAVNGLAVIYTFEVLLAKKNQQIAKSNQAVNQELLRIAEERLSLGNISQNELLQLQMELNLAQKELSTANFQVEKATSNLWAFLGEESNKPLRIALPEQLYTTKIEEEQALAHAQQYRPELLTIERELLEAEMALNKAKKDYGIQANLFAAIGWVGGNPELPPVYHQAQNQQQLSLQINIPIVDWGRRKAAVSIAREELDLVRQQQVQQLIDFRKDIRQAVLLFNQLQEEVVWAKKGNDIAQERFDITRQRYLLSDISITELTIAQREKDQAQRTYIYALQSYWVAYYDLRRLTGLIFTK